MTFDIQSRRPLAGPGLSKTFFCQIEVSSLQHQSIWQEKEIQFNLSQFDNLFDLQDWECDLKAKNCFLLKSFWPFPTGMKEREKKIHNFMCDQPKRDED